MMNLDMAERMLVNKGIFCNRTENKLDTTPMGYVYSFEIHHDTPIPYLRSGGVIYMSQTMHEQFNIVYMIANACWEDR